MDVATQWGSRGVAPNAQKSLVATSHLTTDSGETAPTETLESHSLSELLVVELELALFGGLQCISLKPRSPRMYPSDGACNSGLFVVGEEAAEL